jgi:uncharacterized protein YjiK
MRFLKLIGKTGMYGLLIVFVFSSCKRKVQKLLSPPHYNFAKPLTYKLDLKLKEISGIAWDPVKDIFLAINDEKGVLFSLEKDILLSPKEYPFGGSGDYEDITLVNGVPYILRSDGQITRFITDSSRVYGVEVGKFSLSGTNDFETMYYDPGRKALIAICKNCGLDEGKDIVSAFAFYPDSTGFDSKPVFTINLERVKKLSTLKKARFQPSAAAIHPIYNKLFIISSASRQLVIADLNGNVEAVYQLAKKLFNQPEGITFKQNGDMFISNEGAGGRPTLLKFVYVDQTSESKEQVAKIGYDFTKPDDKVELDVSLREISGMSYVPGKELILAHNDEKGEMFTIDFKSKSTDYQKKKFAGKGDYEDIVYSDSATYILMSNGGVMEINSSDTNSGPKEFILPIEGKNEFETLYRDTDGSLILLCKQCDHEKDKIRAAYKFDPRTDSFSKEPVYEIDITEIQKRLNDDLAEFKPSAAAVHPATGQLFVVASVGKLLAIFSKDGKLEELIRLDPMMYNQPEGMTFAPNGDLYISNEGGEGMARIYKFVYKKK